MQLSKVARSLRPAPTLLAALANWRGYVPAFVLLGFLAYLAVLLATRVVFTSPGYDDSYYGSIARNLAAGRGYVTSYGETVQKFNPEISNGPTVVLPAAALYKLLGDHYWLNNLVVAAMAFPLLGALVWLLARRFRISAATILLIVLTLMLFTNERTDSGEIFRFLFLWTHLMGEIPATLLVILAAALACLARSNRCLHLLAGACLVLALYARAFVLLAIPGFLIAYGWQFHTERRLGPVLAFIAGSLAVALALEMFRLVHLGSWGSYLENSRQVVHFYRTWGPSGDGDASTIGALMRQLKLTLGVIPLLLWVGFVAFERLRTPVGDPERARFNFSLILAMAAVTHFIWWWILNDAGWIRHLIPAIIYFAFGLPVLASLSRMQLVRYSGLLVFLVLLVPQFGAIGEFAPMVRSEARLTALLDTSSFLKSLDSKGVSFWGCGWWANRDLDLVGDVHFYDCSDMDSVARHLAAGERILLVRSEYFNWENNSYFTRLAEECDRTVLFRREPFVVCDATLWLEPSGVVAGG